MQGNALAFLQGNSRQGHPLVILRVGILSTLADGDSMLKVIMYVLDIALSSADTALNPSRRVCMLLDMQGMLWWWCLDDGVCCGGDLMLWKRI